MSSDEQVLRSWSFIRDYRGHKQVLVDLAVGVYSTVCRLKGSPPDKPTCHDMFWKVLHASATYKNIVARKAHLKPILHETFAKKLAMYVLEENWILISSITCP